MHAKFKFWQHCPLNLLRIKAYFSGVRYLPRGISPIDDFPIDDFPIDDFLIDNFPKVRLGLWGAAGWNGVWAQWLEHTEGQALRLEQTGEVAAWEIAHLGICLLGKILWESTYILVSEKKIIKCYRLGFNVSGKVITRKYLKITSKQYLNVVTMQIVLYCSIVVLY